MDISDKEKGSITVSILSKVKKTPGKYFDYSILVEVKDLVTNEKLQFNCRNIADFGYVINPNYEIAPNLKGGVESNGMWKYFFENEGKWKEIRPLSDFEKKSIECLTKFNPLPTIVRL